MFRSLKRGAQLAQRRSLHATAGTNHRHFPETLSVEQAVYNIIHSTPKPPQNHSRKILSCLAHNEPGVISRVSGILQARGFNIESLVAAHTEVPGLSRMTIAINGDDKQINQAKLQLEDLVPMWAVLDYSKTKLVERELLLLRVSILGPESTYSATGIKDEDNELTPENLALVSKNLRETSAHLRALTELTRLFEGKLVDVSSDSVIIELSAKSDRITSFIKLCKPFGVLEATRTGVMALPRSPLIDDQQENDDEDYEYEAVDATSLPPG